MYSKLFFFGKQQWNFEIITPGNVVVTGEEGRKPMTSSHTDVVATSDVLGIMPARRLHSVRSSRQHAEDRV